VKEKKDDTNESCSALDLLARLIADEVRQGRAPAPATDEEPKHEITCIPAPRRERK